MPRPPASALARRRPPRSSPCCCACPTPPAAPPQPDKPPSANTYTTSATRKASTATSTAPPPVLDFLYPGFGFFSRSLPPIVTSPAPAPAPPPPAPLRARPSPFSPPPSYAAAPPPPPRPQAGTFDVRSWRASEGLAAPARTLVAISAGVGGRCVCGRARQSCLRCRAASTSAAVGAVRVAREEGEKAEEMDGKGKGKERESAEEQAEKEEEPRKTRTARVPRELTPAQKASSVQKSREAFRRVRGLPQQPEEVPKELAQKMAAKWSTSARRTPSARLRYLRSQYSVARIVKERTGPPPLSSHPKELSLEEVERAVTALWKAAQDPTLVDGLTTDEKLDLVRLFSPIVRALHDPSTLIVDPLTPFPPYETEASSIDRYGYIRRVASNRMTALLSSLSLWSTETTSSPSSLSSDASARAALLYLDAATLDSVDLLPDAVYAPQTPLDRTDPSYRTRRALERLFRPPPLDAQAAPYIYAHQRHALDLLLAAWARETLARRGDARFAAEQALQFVHAWSAARALEPPLPSLGGGTTASRARAAGHVDVLRRQYGVVLAALSPSPAQWLVDAHARGMDVLGVEQDGEPLGLHVVRFLAPSGGTALAALEAWRVVERLRGEAEEGDQGRKVAVNALDEVKALTSLVDGLRAAGLQQDVKEVADRLIKLVQTVQDDAAASAEHPLSRRDLDALLQAQRVLAKHAASQGRPAKLEELLARLAAIQSDDLARSLEPIARRIRAQAAQHDLAAARATFSSHRAELASAPREDQARLWAQFVLTYTKVNDVEEARKALQEMLDAGLAPTLGTVNAILYGYARRGDVRQTFEFFSQLVEGAIAAVKPNENSWGALVLATTNSRNPASAAMVIEEMKGEGVTPSLQTWTTLMHAYVENGQWTNAFAIFRFLDEHPHPAFRPDTATVNVMLRACVLTATPAQSVLELFRSLVDRGIRPDIHSYSLLFQSVCTAGLMDVAEELFALLDRAGSQPGVLPPAQGTVQPDQHIFASMLAGYLRGGQPEKARVLLAEMRARGMAPSSVTTALVLSSRLSGHRERGQTVTTHGIRSVLQQTRAFLQDEGFLARRRTQPVRLDRQLAQGKAAIALFAPIIRELGKLRERETAIELFEEALGVLEVEAGEDDARTVVELYTAFMDSLSRDIDPDNAYENVVLVWNRAYAALADRHVRLRPDPSASDPLEAPLVRRVDSSHASVLCIPVNILFQTLSRAGRNVDPFWRRLAAEGFAFDASNWNALAQCFARDLQLERALWIVDKVLTVPLTSDDASPDAQLDAFLRDLGGVRRGAAVGRSWGRLRFLRDEERDRQRKNPLDVAALLAPSSSSTSPPLASSSLSSHAPTDTTAVAPPPPAPHALSDVLGATFSASYARRASTVWAPFSATLDALDSGLATLTEEGSRRAYKQQLNVLLARSGRVRDRLEREEGLDAVEAARVAAAGAAEGEARAALGRETDDALVEARLELLWRYPRAAAALEMWRTREERRVRERGEYERRYRSGIV
ncbi:hypothetical protein JCM10207_005292 [Rhodosporidiobolus poonsookiae]